MVMSSLAGCLSTGDLEEISDQDTVSLGKVIASTYHVEQLLSAVAGDLVDVELLSPTNVPVHDYEPTANDILRLQGADVFFYHGLGLEPWVDTTLEGLSTAAPTSVSTHAMPSGENTLDYESILISELCEHITEGPFQNTTLGADENSMPEIHAEHVTYTMSYTHMDDEDHGDEHGDEDHGDEDHGDEDHGDEHGDEHDDHAGHGHARPMETITNPSGCPTDYVIVIYELEKGDVVIEFEAEDDDHDFEMVVLKMGGGHAHHHHDDHDDHGDDDHDDHNGTDDHDDHNGTDEHDDGHDDHGEEHDEMTPEMALQMFDSDNDSHISWDEFWAGWTSNDHDEHNGSHNGSHDDHNGSHNAMEEAMEEYMMGLLHVAFNQSDMYYHNGGNNDAGDGLLNMSELVIFIEEIEHIEDDMESANTQIMISLFDDDDDGNLSMSEFGHFMETMNDGNDNHNGSHEDNGDNHTGHHDEVCYDSSTGSINSAYDNQTNCEAGGLVWTDMEDLMMEMMFNMYDNNSDGYIDASELQMLMEMGDDDHDDHGVIGFATLHVEAEGEYGFLIPADVTLHVLAGEGGHDDHDDHGDEDRDHDDHDDHGDEDRDSDDHDDHGDEDRDHDDHDDHDDHGDEEIPFDPHSWLDPMAFKAQIDVVLAAFIIAFPDGTDTFTANANDYKDKLDAISAGFDSAFGDDGTCTVDKSFAANHNAYSYLAQRYDLEFVTVHGLDPEGEPTAENIAEVVEKITEDEISVFYVEEYTDLSSVDSIVSQTGVTVLYLYTMEMPPSTDGEDYLSLMQKNLDNLVTGLGC